jgi:hypothetical protein
MTPRRPAPGVPILDRPLGSRVAAVTCWVFAEGANTERGWLDHLVQRHRGLNLRLERRCGLGPPRSVVDRASKKRSELRRQRDFPNDEVWAVFDRDGHDDVPGCLRRCVDEGIGVVYSNPCFELWPVLHLDECTAEHTNTALQARLHTLHPRYHHDRGAHVDWPTLDRHAAASRAERLHDRADAAGDALGNPTTTAWLLERRCALGTDRAALAEALRSLPPHLHRLLPHPLRPAT